MYPPINCWCLISFQNEDDDDTYGEPLHTTKPQLLCKPNPRNITGIQKMQVSIVCLFSWPMTLTLTMLHYLAVVFIPLMSFVSEIEAAIKVKGE